MHFLWKLHIYSHVPMASGEKICLQFGSPMLWREPSNHENYELTNGLQNKQNSCPSHPLIWKSIAHSESLPPVCPGVSSVRHQDSEDLFMDDKNEDDFVMEEDKTPHLVRKSELNDHVRGLQISRSKAFFLYSFIHCF